MPQYLREGIVCCNYFSKSIVCMSDWERESERQSKNKWMNRKRAVDIGQTISPSISMSAKTVRPDRTRRQCICVRVPSKRWTGFIDVNWIIPGGGRTRGKRKDLICVMDQSVLNYCQHSWEHLVYLLFLPSSFSLIFCSPLSCPDMHVPGPRFACSFLCSRIQRGYSRGFWDNWIMVIFPLKWSYKEVKSTYNIKRSVYTDFVDCLGKKKRQTAIFKLI